MQNGNTPTSYHDWTNEDLVKRVTELETRLRRLNNQHSQIGTSTSRPKPIAKKPRKASKSFDASKYSTRLIALKFAYLGKRYNGYEYHRNNKTPLPTVEEALWKALRKTRLILPAFEEGADENEVNWEGCGYSKCGRTDRGVSAFGQVIGIRVRSSRPKVKEGTDEALVIGDHARDANGDSRMSDLSDSNENATSDTGRQWDPVADELPYVQLLNRVLPADIRVLAWCADPPPDFSARFSCKERRYRYFFTDPAYVPSPSAVKDGEAWLDIPAMQSAAKKLRGLHDFRNFCKVDPSKQITNFQRRIFHADIKQVSADQEAGAFLSRPPFSQIPSNDQASISQPSLYYFEVHGSAFLWHQVRHMVAILFLVGQGYEDPSIVDKTLDVQSCPNRPMYDMADETPLVLWDCIFPDLAVPDGAPAHSSDGIHMSERNGSVVGSGYVDGLDWICVGDQQKLPAGPGKKSTTGTEDRKYGLMGLMEDLWSQWHTRKIDEVLAGSLMDVVARQGRDPAETPSVANGVNGATAGPDTSARVLDGSSAPRTVGKYVPIMQRSRMEAPEVLNARYAARKGLPTRPRRDDEVDDTDE